MVASGLRKAGFAAQLCRNAGKPKHRAAAEAAATTAAAAAVCVVSQISQEAPTLQVCVFGSRRGFAIFANLPGVRSGRCIPRCI